MSKKLLKAHQGTIVNGQIVYPTTSQAPADPEPIMPTKPRGRPDVPFPTEPRPTIPRIPRSGPEPYPSPFPNQPSIDYDNLEPINKPRFIGKKDPSVNVKPYGQVPDFMQPEQAEQVAPTPRSDVLESRPAIDNIKFDPNNPAPNEMVAADPKLQIQQAMPTQTLQTLQDLLDARKSKEVTQFQQMQRLSNDPNISEEARESVQRQIDKMNFDMRQKQFFGNDREKQRAFADYQRLNQNEMGMRQGQDAIQNLFKDINQEHANEVDAIHEKYNNMGGNPAQNFLMRQRELKDAMLKKRMQAREIEQGDTFKNLSRNLENLQFEDAKKLFDDFSSNYKAVGKGQSVGQPMQFNEGGTVMEKQMEMNFEEKPSMTSGTFLFDEGGMKDDGGEKDPVSGNDVPSGSMAKEVRDDVPAMVSEGEFIFPADVTRFIGLNKLMELRQDAKMGLKKMEAMGQLGNPEDAELPDDIPFDAADIIVIDDEMEVDKKYAGGVFGYQSGTASPMSMIPDSIINKQGEGNQKDESARTYSPITQAANQQYANRYAYYQNDKGDKITILTNWRGEPLQAVPAGYKIMLNQDGSPVTEKPKSEEDKDDVEATQPAAAQGAKQDDDDDKEPETFYSGEYLADKFGGGLKENIILDSNGNPRTMTESGYNAVLTSARRLGLDANTYFNLPMSARFDLIGQEFASMFGKEVDQDYINNIVEQVKAGEYKGKGLFGFLGGIGDWISNLFGNSTPEETQKKINDIDKSNKGKNEVSTTKVGTEYDPKGGKKRYERDDTYGAATNLMRAGDLTTSGRINRGTTSAVRKAQSDKTQAGLAGPGFAAGKFKQDQGDKDIAASRSPVIKNRTDSSGKKAGQKGYKSKLRERQDAKKKRETPLAVAAATQRNIDEGKKTGKYRGFASGTMVTKPKKKPTKGKTLVTKRS